jgi:anti-sigma factor RsiW
MDYVEGRLPPTVHARLEQHLSTCQDCLRSLATYKETVSLLHSLDEADLPVELRLRLRAFLDRGSES